MKFSARRSALSLALLLAGLSAIAAPTFNFKAPSSEISGAESSALGTVAMAEGPTSTSLTGIDAHPKATPAVRPVSKNVPAPPTQKPRDAEPNPSDSPSPATFAVGACAALAVVGGTFATLRGRR